MMIWNIAFICFAFNLGAMCTFNRVWLADKALKWVAEVKHDKHKALCTVCNKIVDLRKMGHSALISHAKSDKHKTLIMSANYGGLALYLRKQSQPVSVDKQSSSSSCPSMSAPMNKQSSSSLGSTSRSISEAFSKNDVLTSEILWTLHTVSKHHSYKSNEDVADLFHYMFPDSEIAKQFRCGEKKSAYMCVFGLAEYFKKMLLSDVNGSNCYTVLFDESLNKKSQKSRWICMYATGRMIE